MALWEADEDREGRDGVVGGASRNSCADVFFDDDVSLIRSGLCFGAVIAENFIEWFPY